MIAFILIISDVINIISTQENSIFLKHEHSFILKCYIQREGGKAGAYLNDMISLLLLFSLDQESYIWFNWKLLISSTVSRIIDATCWDFVAFACDKDNLIIVTLCSIKHLTF